MAFHPYPQVIRSLFNDNQFGPPRCVTSASTCPRVDHQVSRLLLPTIAALFRLAFATDSYLKYLSSLVTVTRRLIMQKARRHSLKLLRPLVSVWFQGLFHSVIHGSFHLSLTVLCAIGRYQYFGLEGGPPCFPQGFTCLVVLWIQSHVCKVSITGLSPSAAELSSSILLPHLHLMTVLNPGAVARSGLASFPFARRY